MNISNSYKIKVESNHLFVFQLCVCPRIIMFSFTYLLIEKTVEITYLLREPIYILHNIYRFYSILFFLFHFSVSWANIVSLTKKNTLYSR